MQVTALDPDHPLLDAVYDDLLVTAFPPDELITRDELRSGLAGGGMLGSLVVAHDRPVGVALGEFSADSGVLLLAYMSVRGDARSGGIGGLLMESAVRGSWQERLHPLITLAEIEHPAAHAADARRGDPSARLRFYARQGARALDTPYFQPALRPGAARVPGMLLGVLATAPSLAGATAIPSEPVRLFLTDYFVGTEGKVPDDAAARLLFEAVDRPGGIALLPMDDPALLPCAYDV
ncbi:N-acetyltransferase [Streptomyces polygonati]|uniref:N-acetyltransferase n=1 Tax=Streptomyces polygonati TaxID=1617087 RepID=A0ABV8HF23_9ACTN